MGFGNIQCLDELKQKDFLKKKTNHNKIYKNLKNNNNAIYLKIPQLNNTPNIKNTGVYFGGDGDAESNKAFTDSGKIYIRNQYSFEIVKFLKKALKRLNINGIILKKEIINKIEEMIINLENVEKKLSYFAENMANANNYKLNDNKNMFGGNLVLSESGLIAYNEEHEKLYSKGNNMSQSLNNVFLKFAEIVDNGNADKIIDKISSIIDNSDKNKKEIVKPKIQNIVKPSIDNSILTKTAVAGLATVGVAKLLNDSVNKDNSLATVGVTKLLNDSVNKDNSLIDYTEEQQNTLTTQPKSQPLSEKLLDETEIVLTTGTEILDNDLPVNNLLPISMKKKVEFSKSKAIENKNKIIEYLIIFYKMLNTLNDIFEETETIYGIEKNYFNNILEKNENTKEKDIKIRPIRKITYFGDVPKQIKDENVVGTVNIIFNDYLLFRDILNNILKEILVIGNNLEEDISNKLQHYKNFIFFYNDLQKINIEIFISENNTYKDNFKMSPLIEYLKNTMVEYFKKLKDAFIGDISYINNYDFYPSDKIEGQDLNLNLIINNLMEIYKLYTDQLSIYDQYLGGNDEVRETQLLLFEEIYKYRIRGLYNRSKKIFDFIKGSALKYEEIVKPTLYTITEVEKKYNIIHHNKYMETDFKNLYNTYVKKEIMNYYNNIIKNYEENIITIDKKDELEKKLNAINEIVKKIKDFGLLKKYILDDINILQKDIRSRFNNIKIEIYKKYLDINIINFNEKLINESGKSKLDILKIEITQIINDIDKRDFFKLDNTLYKYYIDKFETILLSIRQRLLTIKVEESSNQDVLPSIKYTGIFDANFREYDEKFNEILNKEYDDKSKKEEFNNLYHEVGYFKKDVKQSVYIEEDEKKDLNKKIDGLLNKIYTQTDFYYKRYGGKKIKKYKVIKKKLK
jgi:hypothetical protein